MTLERFITLLINSNVIILARAIELCQYKEVREHGMALNFHYIDIHLEMLSINVKHNGLKQVQSGR